MLEDLFKFPVILIDSMNEEKKLDMSETERLALGEEDPEFDIIYGEAEYPYHDFVGIEDRWLPDKDSLKRALKGKFNACLVKFNNVGLMLVPWTRDKFKKEFEQFVKSRESQSQEEISENPKITVLRITPEMISGLIKQEDEKNSNG